MVKIEDPTTAYATVVSRRRRSRASGDAQRYRLGLHGLDCGLAVSPTEPAAVIGASAWALKAEQVERTVEVIGLTGGLLADLGFHVCPIGADANRVQPSLIVWICGDETQADEYEQLAAIGAPGLSVGSCVEGLPRWRFVESEDVDDRHLFAQLFVRAVGDPTRAGDHLGSDQR